MGAPSSSPARNGFNRYGVSALLLASVLTCMMMGMEFEFLPNSSSELSVVVKPTSVRRGNEVPTVMTLRAPVVYHQPDTTLHRMQGRYTCIGWRATTGCDPDGTLVSRELVNCSTPIHGGNQSGYCELQDRDTEAIHRVTKLFCDSLKRGISVKCEDAASYVNYAPNALEYVHDRQFSYERSQRHFLLDALQVRRRKVSGPSSFARGIVLVVYELMLPSAYASIRNLRAMGCRLPIELWFRPSEVPAQHPILQALVRQYGAFGRIIRDGRATQYYAKMYAIFYSAFDSVLFLDADNFAVRDPTYLFDTTEFQDTGALFWPDYRRPARRGDWDIVDHSLLWEILDMDFADMFEQESGQIVIDRRRHQRALNVLMFFGFHQPRILDDLMLVWGDKDLFRLAWLKTDSPFYWSGRPAGSAGQYDPKSKRFCGVTIVQHDPAGDIIFLHRNTCKLTPKRMTPIWTHIQQFQVDAPLSEYTVTSTVAAPDFKGLNNCYGEDRMFANYNITEMTQFPFHQLEQRLFEYVSVAARLRLRRKLKHVEAVVAN